MPSAHHSPLHKALRNAARWSLYLALALVLGVGGAIYALLGDKFQVIVNPWRDVDFLDYRSVRDLQQLVRIDTTHETGREMDAALWIEDQLLQSGIASHIEDMGEGKANLWAKIEGETDQFIVLHSHLDTDPVGEIQRWNFDPWSANIEIVWLYARGSFDMKSTIVAQLHTMQALKERIERTGQRPHRGLMMLSTSSEETGSHEGAQHIVNDRPELLDGAWALFSEGGVIEAIDLDAVKYLGISFGQKRFVDVWYRASTKEPLEELAHQIQSRPQPSNLRVTPTVRTFLKPYGPTRQLLAAHKVLTEPDVVTQDQQAFDDLPTFYKSLFRDEVHTLGPEPDPESDGFRMRVVVHLLEDTNAEEALTDFLPRATDLPAGITFNVDPSIGSKTSSPLDHPAYVALETALRDELEDSTIGPYYLTVFANDSQFFRKLGIPSYGFQPFLGIAADSYAVGGYNERIALPTYVDGVDRYRKIMLDLTEMDAN